MVSQEQSCIHFLKWRISSNTWCEKLKWQYSTIRMSEYDGEGWNQQAVHSITVCQEQMPRWSIAGITNTEWLVPFQWFNSSFSIWWLANHQCGQKKSVSTISYLWINPQLLEKLTQMCCFFQDSNGRQTVFVSYKQQQHCSPFIDWYFLIQSSNDKFFYRNMHQFLTSSICGKWSKIEAKCMLLCTQNMNS